MPYLFPDTPASHLRLCVRFEILCDGTVEPHVSGFIPATCDAPNDDDFLRFKDSFSAHDEMAMRRAIHDVGCPLHGTALESLTEGVQRLTDSVCLWLTDGTLDSEGCRRWTGDTEGDDDPLEAVAWEQTFFAFYFTFDDTGKVIHTSCGVAGIEGDPLQAIHSSTVEGFLKLLDTFRARPDGHPFPEHLQAA